MAEQDMAWKLLTRNRKEFTILKKREQRDAKRLARQANPSAAPQLKVRVNDLIGL